MYLQKRVKYQDGFMWECHCRKYKSTRNGSFFEKSRSTLNKIILLIYHWARELSQDTAIHELNISNKTAIDWYNFCRDVCHDDAFNRSEKIGGPDIIVEIDESAFGKRKEKSGRLTVVKWVFGGVERGTGKCFMVQVERRNAETLVKYSFITG